MDDRGNPSAHDILSFGPFHLIAAERLLKKAGEPVHLGGRALDILITLVERAGEVVSRRELISRVWSDVTVEEANLRVHIASLRKALGDGRDGARYIANVPGRGYSFVAPVQRSAQIGPTPGVSVRPVKFQTLPARLQRMVGRDEIIKALCSESLLDGSSVSWELAALARQLWLSPSRTGWRQISATRSASWTSLLSATVRLLFRLSRRQSDVSVKPKTRCRDC
jgi:DNA-binding winged helix-turn-helix (wHTH) protein